MKNYIVTLEHHKYFNGGVSKHILKVEVYAKNEKSAMNKALKTKKSTKHNIYCVLSAEEK